MNQENKKEDNREESANVCNKCGAVLKKVQRYCPKCGEPLTLIDKNARELSATIDRKISTNVSEKRTSRIMTLILSSSMSVIIGAIIGLIASYKEFIIPALEIPPLLAIVVALVSALPVGITFGRKISSISSGFVTLLVNTFFVSSLGFVTANLTSLILTPFGGIPTIGCRSGFILFALYWGTLSIVSIGIKKEWLQEGYKRVRSFSIIISIIAIILLLAPNIIWTLSYGKTWLRESYSIYGFPSLLEEFTDPPRVPITRIRNILKDLKNILYKTPAESRSDIIFQVISLVVPNTTTDFIRLINGLEPEKRPMISMRFNSIWGEKICPPQGISGLQAFAFNLPADKLSNELLLYSKNCKYDISKVTPYKDEKLWSYFAKAFAYINAYETIKRVDTDLAKDFETLVLPIINNFSINK